MPQWVKAAIGGCVGVAVFSILRTMIGVPGTTVALTSFIGVVSAATLFPKARNIPWRSVALRAALLYILLVPYFLIVDRTSLEHQPLLAAALILGIVLWIIAILRLRAIQLRQGGSDATGGLTSA